MFDAQGLVKENVQFGFELQINACYPAGTRLGVLCWNNSATGNYQNTSNFGVATLSPEGRFKKAATPTITVQPKDANYYVGQSEPVANLSVTATVTPTGDGLSYQWWSANSADGAGAEIASATGSTYTPPITTEGDTWYWVVITNTDNSADEGHKTATVTSRKAFVGVDADATAFKADYELDFTDDPRRSPLMPASSDYASAVVIDTPRLFIHKYAKYTFVIKTYGEDGTTEITPGYGVVQLKMRDAANVQIGGQIDNIGAESGTSTADIPSAILTAGGVAKLDFETSSNWASSEARYIEIISIKFHN
jgi:predicted DNA binding protein